MLEIRMPISTLVSLTTTHGKMVIALYPEKAPETVANFLNYIDKKLFDGSSIFRIVTNENANQIEDKNTKITVVQAGIQPEHSKLLEGITHETTLQTGIEHLDGTISMARFEPGTADGSFFFCINDQPELNYGGKRYDDGLGFAAFGRITQGREVLGIIFQQAEAQEYLKKEITITSIVRC